jgi:hypothetical protein
MYSSVLNINYARFDILVLCLVYIDQLLTYTSCGKKVLVVISKLLGMRQLPRMNILVKKKIGCVIKINNTGKGQCINYARFDILVLCLVYIDQLLTYTSCGKKFKAKFTRLNLP